MSQVGYPSPSEDRRAANRRLMTALLDTHSQVFALYHTNPGGPTRPIVAQFLAHATELALRTAPYPILPPPPAPSPHQQFRDWIAELSATLAHRSHSMASEQSDIVISKIHETGYDNLMAFFSYLYMEGEA